MPPSKTRSSLLVFVCTLIGCVDPKSSLGELPDASSGATEPTTAASEPTDTASDSLDTAGDPTTVGDASVTVTGEVDFDDVGAPCEPSFLPQGTLLEDENEECSSGMCLYSQMQPYVDETRICATAEDCGVEHAICNETGHCQIDPAHVAARSMCTEACEQDSDCVGVDGTTCATGFACAPVAQLGANCCQPVCVCRDDLDVEVTNTLAQACANGQAEGCCDQDPVPDACGG